MTSSLPRRILVHSTKYDGSLHNRFEADLVAIKGEQITIEVQAGTPWASYRGDGSIANDFTGHFYTDRWYNVYTNPEPTPRGRVLVYANVATPAVLDGDVLRWVDLDLDVFVREDGAAVLDDEDEFAEHLKRWAYPDDLIERARTTASELMKLARSGSPPFDHNGRC